MLMEEKGKAGWMKANQTIENILGSGNRYSPQPSYFWLNPGRGDAFDSIINPFGYTDHPRSVF